MAAWLKTQAHRGEHAAHAVYLGSVAYGSHEGAAIAAAACLLCVITQAWLRGLGYGSHH